MFCQAQLIRLGFYEIGLVDGVFGSKTINILKKMTLDVLPINELCSVLKNK